MDQCSPEEMRKNLEIVNELKKAGIKFIPIPVMDDSDNIKLKMLLNSRLDFLLKIAEEIEELEVPPPSAFTHDLGGKE